MIFTSVKPKSQGQTILPKGQQAPPQQAPPEQATPPQEPKDGFTARTASAIGGGLVGGAAGGYAGVWAGIGIAMAVTGGDLLPGLFLAGEIVPFTATLGAAGGIYAGVKAGQAIYDKISK